MGISNGSASSGPITTGTTYAQNAQPGILNSNGSLLTSNGPKNYISNSSLENGSVGTAQQAYLAFNNSGTPATNPTFGSAGTNSATVSTTTTNPISGTTSLLMSFAGNPVSAGTGFALGPFAIEPEDRAKCLQFKCSYQVVSGSWQLSGNPTFTYSTQSIAVTFWDATNSQYLNTSFNFVQGSGVGTHTSTFQTGSTTASVYVVFYSPYQTGAASMAFDSFFLGPQMTAQAPAMSDWTSYTPTISVSSGAISAYTVSAFYKQEGDKYHLRGALTFTGTSTTWSGFLINPPPGLTLDTTKLGSTYWSDVGTFSVVKNGSQGYATGLAVYNSGSIALLGTQSSSSNGFAFANGISSTVPFTFAANDVITWDITIPIVGKSSNTVMSADTDTRVIAARATSSSTSLTSSAAVVIFPTLTYDTSGSYSTSTGLYTVSVAGKYSVKTYLQTNSVALASNGAFVGFIYKNGSQYSQIFARINETGSTSASAAWVGVGGDEVDCKPGDTLAIYASISNATSLNSVVGYIAIERLSGPAVVQATESVNMSYSNTAGTSISASTNTLIPFASKQFDSHSAWTGTQYNAPVTGKYRVTCALQMTGTVLGTTQNWFSMIYKNGSSVTQLGGITGNGQNNFWYINGSYTISLNAGDYIQIYANSSVATSLNTANSYLTIERVGN